MILKKHFLLFLFISFLIIFALGRIVFALYNMDIEHLSPMAMLQVSLQGLLLDCRTSALLLLVPALCSLQQRISLKTLLIPYYILVAIVLILAVGADIIMYEFWKFKLSAVVISYAMSPEAATSSVEPIFLFTRIGCTLISILLLITLLSLLTPKHAIRQGRMTLLMVILSLIPIGISQAYRSNTSLFRNHMATNSLYAFVTSFWAQHTFNIMPKQSAKATYDSLYVQNTGSDIQDTLLNTKRPNILIIQVESFGGKFIKELGGLPNVAPQMSRLIPEGIFFTSYYSNSFRTDRGTVSLQSGITAHPTISLMRERKLHTHLASLPLALKKAGYETAYLYAGPMTNMNKRQYLEDLSIDTLYDYTAFTPQQLNSSWGAHDGMAAYRLLQLLDERKHQTQPWMFTFQTISSHEPWIVPYHRLSDAKLNAFAYTDDVIGQFIDTLKNKAKLWDNLLVIIIPDHGYLYEQTYEHPDFFHAPMLWLGGAIRHPHSINTLMNQSDIAATLLAQLALPADQFIWSRNILSRKYTRPMVYCTFPAGVMLKDKSGTIIYDLTARHPIVKQGAASSKHIHTARALLQYSYDQLK